MFLLFLCLFPFGSPRFSVPLSFSRRFSFVARKGLFSLMDKFSTMALNVAFVIEGRDDGELPEVALGCAKLDCMDALNLPMRDFGGEEV